MSTVVQHQPQPRSQSQQPREAHSPCAVAVMERVEEVAMLSSHPCHVTHAHAGQAQAQQDDHDEHNNRSAKATPAVHLTHTITRVTMSRSPPRHNAAAAATTTTAAADADAAAARSPSLRSLHRESVKPTRRGGATTTSTSTLLRRLSGAVDYHGAGPTLPPAHTLAVYPCFDEQNGLLFRLEDALHHTWYFYNDTAHYRMHVTATFGHESMVTALGTTTLELLDRDTGHCTLTLCVGPGETLPFMKGEYNGFVIHYDAEPLRGRHRRPSCC